jgi:hypothetical protein
MENVPLYVSIAFIITTLLTLFFFYKGTNHSKPILIIVLIWMAIQAGLALSGFFLKTDPIPPRFPILLAPPVLTILFLFLMPKGRQLIDGFDAKWLTWLHIIRIPVELVLFWLFVHKQIPQLMTFEGKNLDIISGLTAPLIAWFGYNRGKLNKPVLLIWNFVCLGLLLNVVIRAILALPSPFQQFAFDQPNTGVLYFPFIWLPGFIVPAVLLSHLVSIRRLVKS